MIFLDFRRRPLLPSSPRADLSNIFAIALLSTFFNSIGQTATSSQVQFISASGPITDIAGAGRSRDAVVHDLVKPVGTGGDLGAARRDVRLENVLAHVGKIREWVGR